MSVERRLRRNFRDQRHRNYCGLSNRWEVGSRPSCDELGRKAACHGKKIKGKKRHILVDTQGLLMHAIVHAADIQDRDGGVLLMATAIQYDCFRTDS